MPDKPVKGNHDNDVLALADEIAAYLESHPDAADSFEGIVTWWLDRQRYARAKRSVEQALERLQARGLVRIDDTPAGRIYSSTRHRR